MTTRASGRPKRRRRHAATGARILAAGLATSATLGFASAMADTAVRTAGDDAQPAVVVPDTSRSSPTVTPTNAPPVTTSHAS